MKAIYLSLVICFLSFRASWSADAENGKKLFRTHGCTSCHSLEAGKSSRFGPSLADVTKKRKAEWLKKWIKDPDSMRNDPEIKKLGKKYPPMPATNLDDKQVEDIIAYLEAVSKGELPKEKSSGLGDLLPLTR